MKYFLSAILSLTVVVTFLVTEGNAQQDSSAYLQYMAQQKAQQQLYQRGLSRPVNQNVAANAYKNDQATYNYHKHLIESKTGRSYTYQPQPRVTQPRYPQNYNRYGNNYNNYGYNNSGYNNYGYNNYGYNNYGYNNYGYNNGGVGYQPVIVVPSTGIGLGTRAVVTPDGRYVRIGF